MSRPICNFLCMSFSGLFRFCVCTERRFLKTYHKNLHLLNSAIIRSCHSSEGASLTEKFNSKRVDFCSEVGLGNKSWSPNMGCRLLDKDLGKELLDSVDTVLLDCDGVLWSGLAAAPLPGVPETIQKIRDMGKAVYFVSNNSVRTREQYVEKCTRLQYPCKESEIIGSAYVTAQYIKNTLQYTGPCYVLGSPGLVGELENAGITCTGLGEDPLDGRTLVDLENTEFDPEIKCVVVGFDLDFNYIKMHKAAHYLNQPGCHFIATNTDSALPLPGGRLLPGTGAFVKAVEWAAGREAVVCGKPNTPIKDALIKEHGVDPSKTLMVGDRLDTDIALAKNCGMKSLLVLTGVSGLEDVKHHRDLVPDFYLPSLDQLGQFIS